MVVGLLIWMITNMPVWLRMWRQISKVVLSAFGLDANNFYSSIFHSSAGSTQYQVPFLVLIIFCAIVPLFLSAIVVEIYSMIATNKDTRQYRKNEKSKNANSINIANIVNSAFGMLFAFTSLVITAIVPFSKVGNFVGVALTIVGVYIASFVIQEVLYKIITKQLANLNRYIKNRKAWRENMSSFRVFISSTFKNFEFERNYLAQNLYAPLNNSCRRKGYAFHAIDLRWGISTEASLDNKSMLLCLDEIKNIKKRTLNPIF